MIGHITKQVEVVLREHPFPLVQALHDANQLARHRPHRHAHNAAGYEAGALINRAVETFVVIRAIGANRFATLIDVSGNPTTVEDADFSFKVALGHT